MTYRASCVWLFRLTAGLFVLILTIPGHGVEGNVSLAHQDIVASDHSPKLMIPADKNSRTVSSSLMIYRDSGFRSAFERIESQLNSSTEIEAVNASLSAIVAHFSTMHEITIELDRFAMAEVGLDESTPISIDVHGISLESALYQILDPLHMSYMIKDNVLLITSQDRCYPELHTKFYFVGDISFLDEGSIEVVYSSFQRVRQSGIVQLILDTVAPDEWDEVGGRGSIYLRNETLIVMQHRSALAEIDSLLEQLREYQDRLDDLQAKQRNEAATAINDQSSSESGSYDTERSDANLGQTLDTEMQIKVYPIAFTQTDSPLPEGIESSEQGIGNGQEAANSAEEDDYVIDSWGAQEYRSGASPVELLELIPALVSNHNWDNVGGTATIRIAGSSLVIKQTPASHAEIAQLLDRLGVLQVDPNLQGDGFGGGIF